MGGFLITLLAVISVLMVAFCEESSLVSDRKRGDVCVEKKMIPQSPFTDFFRLWNKFDQFQVYPHFTSSLLMDIKETPTEYQVHVDLPGVEKGDIKITVSPSQQELQISAFKQGQKHEEGHEYKMVERYSGNMTRTLYLPELADVNKLSAKFQGGVLELQIPKLPEESAKAKHRTIEIQ